jgi:SH3 domain-containing YSC84-like protein 1
LAPIFSYSKSKGLFAGISIEGSVIVERKDANNIFYGRTMSPKEILSGSVVPPISCQPLFDELNLQSEIYNAPIDTNQQPSYGSQQGGNGYKRQSNPLPRYENQPTVPVKPKFGNYGHNQRQSLTQSSSHYQQPDYDNQNEPPYGTQSNDRSTDRYSSTKYQYRSSILPTQTTNDSKFISQNEFGDFKSPKPPKPPQRLPIAKALYKFSGERDTDLSLEVGDLVTVLKRGEDEWWTGRVGRREGDFPANYVRIEE